MPVVPREIVTIGCSATSSTGACLESGKNFCAHANQILTPKPDWGNRESSSPPVRHRDIYYGSLQALSAEYGTARLLAIPLNDAESGYNYPARVRWTLAQDELRSYQDAAEFLNFNNIDMVCLQHEYGIFGGPAGSHILHLLRRLKMPAVTTLHTVLREPTLIKRW